LRQLFGQGVAQECQGEISRQATIGDIHIVISVAGMQIPRRREDVKPWNPVSRVGKIFLSVKFLESQRAG
jgi:hypothetical protein